MGCVTPPTDFKAGHSQEMSIIRVTRSLRKLVIIVALLKMTMSARKFTPFGIVDILSDTFDTASRRKFCESSVCQHCNGLMDDFDRFTIVNGKVFLPGNKGNFVFYQKILMYNDKL